MTHQGKLVSRFIVPNSLPHMSSLNPYSTTYVVYEEEMLRLDYTSPGAYSVGGISTIPTVTVKRRTVYNQNTGLIENPTGPAVTMIDNGKVTSEQWYMGGKLHNDRGPATVEIQKNRSSERLRRVKYSYYVNGEIDTRSAPIIHVDTVLENGKERIRSAEEWWVNSDDKFHRIDGPALILHYDFHCPVHFNKDSGRCSSLHPTEEWYIHGEGVTTKITEWAKHKNLPHWSKWDESIKSLVAMKWL